MRRRAVHRSGRHRGRSRGAGRERSLEEVVIGALGELRGGGSAGCPVCGERSLHADGCAACGSGLS